MGWGGRNVSARQRAIRMMVVCEQTHRFDAANAGGMFGRAW